MNKSFQFTDEELIFRFQNGDEQSYIELVKRYKDRLINFVFRLVNDRDQAEDIIQDTMLKLYTHKHYYKNIAKFSTCFGESSSNSSNTTVPLLSVPSALVHDNSIVASVFSLVAEAKKFTLGLSLVWFVGSNKFDHSYIPHKFELLCPLKQIMYAQIKSYFF